MIEEIKNSLKRMLYNKSEEERSAAVGQNSEVHFTLKIGELVIGYLAIENHLWTFKYSEEFKDYSFR